MELLKVKGVIMKREYKDLNLLVRTEFGLEAVTKRELQGLGYDNLKVTNGRIVLPASLEDIPRLNLNLRTAERVLVLVAEFKAFTFEHLFQGVKKFPWEEWILPTGQIVVKGRSRNSKLHSVPTCQAITKKAIIDRLSQTYRRQKFPETGAMYAVEVEIDQDQVLITLDTSGTGLHKRGYRKQAGMAPLKETLAAGMVMLSYWRKERVLLDPLCGSGTIPIEAALFERNIAPGLFREFDSEHWGVIHPEQWEKERAICRSRIKNDFELRIKASDIDASVLEMAKANAIAAGVADDIEFSCLNLTELKLTEPYGILITNPPYGERWGTDEEIDLINETLRELMRDNPTWSYYMITSNVAFEQAVGRLADRTRKFYNGRIKVGYYQFYGPRPPKVE